MDSDPQRLDMDRLIDLRSDTVTRPGPEMRQAIAEAVVGDDVFGDDPTVRELERRVAEMLGKEAALFVPSGTMANQVALASITEPGDEVVLDRQSHIFNYEVAAASALSGLQLTPVDGHRGVLDPADVERTVRPENVHHPRTRVIALENTHNRGGGRVYPLAAMEGVAELARDLGLKVHLDGARLANAVVASGVPFRRYAACADTVTMCFSKGLGAPVGSIIVSDGATIARARRKRKMFGGGMRQVGILAAAAIYALDHHVERLEEDHRRARRLGEAVSRLPGLHLVHPIETNIVVFQVNEGAISADDLLARLEEWGILAVPFGPGLIRMVTHLDVSEEDVEYVCRALEEAVAS